MLELETVTGAIIGAAIEVHRDLGPGFLEKIYERALCIAFEERGIAYQRQLTVPFYFHGKRAGKHRIDVLVVGAIVVELKAIKAFEPIHFATLQSYLRASRKRIGLLFNFNGLKLDVKRILNPACR